ncbi:MAG: thiolase family protein, partial [Phycisphaerae bacterium]|nr:thiolase family protein [Phycisphaerae bacterium]
DPLCNMIMGKTAEVLAHEFGLSRREQDTFAMHSHHKAVAAAESGRFADQIVPVYAGKRCEAVAEDIGPRPGQTLEALGKLRPLFDRKDGTVTVGNACQVTDGAAALLVADAELARSEGLEVQATIRGYAAAGLDPHRMGLGPVYAMDKLLQEQGLALSDIGLFEINEAFAAQVLACLKAMGSDTFARKELGRSSAVGELDPEKLNVNGGAVALGHPVGATGARMVLNLVTEMKQRDVQFAVASLCVAGGQGAAILLERS